METNGLSVKDWQTEWQFAYAALFMNSSINLLLYCWQLQRQQGKCYLKKQKKTRHKMLSGRKEALSAYSETGNFPFFL